MKKEFVFESQAAIDIAFAVKRSEENDLLLRRLLAYALALERLKK